MLLSVLAVILVFGAIILVHEMGHLLAARSVGVAVPDFSLGMGPSLASFKLGETRFHLSLLPIGGYARIAGLSDDVADAPGAPKDEGLLPTSALWGSKSGFQKAWILIAGPLANVVFAFVAALLMGFVGFPESMVMIGGVLEDSPATEAGIQFGDEVTAIAETRVTSGQHMTALIRAQKGNEFTIEYIRGGQQHITLVTPRILEGFNNDIPSVGISSFDTDRSSTVISLVQPKTQGYSSGLKVGDRVLAVNGKQVLSALDIYREFPDRTMEGELFDGGGELVAADELADIEISLERDGEIMAIMLPAGTTLLDFGAIFKPILTHLPMGDSLKRSVRDAYNMTTGIVLSMSMLFRPEVAKSVGGPVAIMSIIGQSSQSGWWMFLQIIIMINLWLGMFNLLPVPALDGGRLVFVSLHGMGIHVSEKREMLIHAVGMILLLCLIGLITLTDIMAFF